MSGRRNWQQRICSPLPACPEEERVRDGVHAAGQERPRAEAEEPRGNGGGLHGGLGGRGEEEGEDEEGPAHEGDRGAQRSAGRQRKKIEEQCRRRQKVRETLIFLTHFVAT